jgi:hypothetical protein
LHTGQVSLYQKNKHKQCNQIQNLTSHKNAGALQKRSIGLASKQLALCFPILAFLFYASWHATKSRCKRGEVPAGGGSTTVLLTLRCTQRLEERARFLKPSVDQGYLLFFVLNFSTEVLSDDLS